VSWLLGPRLADGRTVDIELIGATIARVVDRSTGEQAGEQAGERASEPPMLTPQERASATDLSGYLLLTAPAEPHAHLDKALTSHLVPNPTGDLAGAIDGWVAFFPTLTVADMADRAEQAALELVASGVTAVRTHVNVHEGIDLKAVEALLTVKARIGHLIDIQIVSLTGWVTGLGAVPNRALLRSSLQLDPEIIVGGCPHLDEDPLEATDIALEIAGETGRMLDLHTDETLDVSHLELRYLAQRIKATGFTGHTAASHCVSLGMVPPDVQAAVAAEVATAKVAVITLPQTNLFLQARGIAVGPPRGLTAIRPLLNAGAVVGAGADNVRDPFNSMGRSDPFETAALLVMAGHLLPEDAWALVTDGARRSMGLAPVTLAPGGAAEFVAVRGANLGDAIARADQDRIVWHRGQVVARTTVTREFRALTSPGRSLND
jgi:cytosine/creatinine deaminase